MFFFFYFCLLSSVLDSNVDAPIALAHLGHAFVKGGVFMCVSFGLCVCESLRACIHECATHIECNKTALINLLLALALLFFPPLNRHWLANIHKCMLTMSEPCVGAVYAMEYI